MESLRGLIANHYSETPKKPSVYHELRQYTPEEYQHRSDDFYLKQVQEQEPGRGRKKSKKTFRIFLNPSSPAEILRDPPSLAIILHQSFTTLNNKIFARDFQIK